MQSTFSLDCFTVRFYNINGSFFRESFNPKWPIAATSTRTFYHYSEQTTKNFSKNVDPPQKSAQSMHATNVITGPLLVHKIKPFSKPGVLYRRLLFHCVLLSVHYKAQVFVWNISCEQSQKTVVIFWFSIEANVTIR